MADFQFVSVDVFTTERFGGNPLAVVPDACGLTTEQMAAIAREFNYSESTFVFPPDDPAHTAQVRIFTPTAEVPFAGHPNVGTAWVLATQGTAFDRPVGDGLVFEEQAGLVTVRVDRFGDHLRTAITAPETLNVAGIPAEVGIAACASLASTDLSTRSHPPVMAGVGLTFAIAEVQDLDTLVRARPDTAAFAAADAILPGLPGGLALFIYARISKEPLVVQARMFAPLDNIPEDPATGSASGALGALLTSLRPERDLEVAMQVRQGFEMGRPSYIDLRISKRNGAITRTEISGSCVPVMTGTISV